MPLTANELAQLSRLQAKAGEPAEPMTDADLAEIERTVSDLYHRNIDVFAQTMALWNDHYCPQFKAIVDQNARLIAEVRRLQAELARALKLDGKP